MSVKKKLIIFTAGAALAIGVVAYMLFADLWNQYVSNLLIADYVQQTESSESYAEEYAAAEEYNEALLYSETTEEWYESLLDISENGMMGYISIPKINIALPIYHYTSDESLLKGAGHMYGTSLPVGGESTHAVISAHRGLPSMTLFTDLDQMEEGDLIYIVVLGRLLAYEVYDVEVVLPEEVDGLGITAGEDLLTLVTCTPYGVNTHRLLVHAKRTELSDEEEISVYAEVSSSTYTIDTNLVIVLAFELIIYAAGMILIWRSGREEEEEDISPDDIHFSDEEWSVFTGDGGL